MTTETLEETKQTTELATKPKAAPIVMGARGLELRALDDMWRFAKCIAESGLAPKGVDTPQAIVVALQMGAEVGLPPLAALQNIAVINGRPSIWGDGLLAICRGSGVFDEEAFEETIEGEGDKMVAVCRVKRSGKCKLVERRFSIEDAKRAGLLGKQGPWSQYPKRMLQMRARSWALRDAFTDALRGFRCAEETFDVIDIPKARTVERATASSVAGKLTLESARPGDTETHTEPSAPQPPSAPIDEPERDPHPIDVEAFDYDRPEPTAPAPDTSVIKPHPPTPPTAPERTGLLGQSEPKPAAKKMRKAAGF